MTAKLLTQLRILCVAALALLATGIAAAPSDPGTIHLVVTFRASPERIYEALLNENQFRAFSGAPAEIQREGGGAFKLIRGRVTGRNVQLVPNQRIVQAWRVESWPSGTYTIVRFELTAASSGTRVVLDQTGFPRGEHATLVSNWTRFYWDPLRKYLDSESALSTLRERALREGI